MEVTVRNLIAWSSDWQPGQGVQDAYWAQITFVDFQILLCDTHKMLMVI